MISALTDPPDCDRLSIVEVRKSMYSGQDSRRFCVSGLDNPKRGAKLRAFCFLQVNGRDGIGVCAPTRP